MAIASYSPISTFSCLFRKSPLFMYLCKCWKSLALGSSFWKSWLLDSCHMQIQETVCSISVLLSKPAAREDTTVLLSLVHLRQCGRKFGKSEPWRWTLVKSNDVSFSCLFSAGDKSDRSQLREPVTLGTGKNRSCKGRKGSCRQSHVVLLFYLINVPGNYVKTMPDLSSNWDIMKVSIIARSPLPWCT